MKLDPVIEQLTPHQLFTKSIIFDYNAPYRLVSLGTAYSTLSNKFRTSAASLSVSTRTV